MKYTLCFIALFFCACSSKIEGIQKVYNNKDTLIKLFSSKSVIRSRGQNIILFYTHADQKTNRYFFEINNNQYQLTNDSIEYTPDILQLKDEKGSELYKQELTSYVQTLLSKMDQLDIRDIEGGLSDVGIDLKIYMKQLKGIIIYVSNPGKITGAYWVNYLKSKQKLDDNWYYTTNEE